MIFGDGVRVLVQPRLAILSSIIWQMREVEKARLLGLVLFLEIGGVHDGWRDLRQGLDSHNRMYFQGDEGPRRYL